MTVAHSLYFFESNIKKYQLCTRFWQVLGGVSSLRWDYGLPMFFVQVLVNGFQHAVGQRKREEVDWAARCVSAIRDPF